MSRKDEPSTEEILSKLIWIESAMKKKPPKTNAKGNAAKEDVKDKNETKDEYSIHNSPLKSQNSRPSSVYRTGVEKYSGGTNVDKPPSDIYEENKTNGNQDNTREDEKSSPMHDNNGSRQDRDKRNNVYGEGSTHEPYRNDEQSSTRGSRGYSYIAREDPNVNDDGPSYKSYRNSSKPDKSQKSERTSKNSRGSKRYSASPNKETKFQMIRNADSPCTDDLVSLGKLTKYTKRLKYTLYELKDEVAGNKEYQDSVDGLISKVEWFLKDLDQSNGSCEQTFILLEKYDIYRTAYYCIRKKIDTIQVKDTKYYNRETGDEDYENAENEDNAYEEDNMVGNGESRSLKSGYKKYRGNEEEYVTNGRLYECPGVTDVRKGSNDRRYQYWEDSSKYLSWCETLKKYCCICFPCTRK